MKRKISSNFHMLLFIAVILISLVDCQKTNEKAAKEVGSNDQKPVIQPQGRMPATNLYYSKECQDDITRYCPRAKNTILTDMAVLQCIHNEVADLNLIDKPCHNVI